MQEPYRAADRTNHLQQDGSNFAEWVAGLNRVLSVAFNSEHSVDDLPSLLDNRSPQENRAISHFIDATLPPDFALCIGVVPARATAKEFFNAIKTRCCPGNRFQKLQVVKDLLNLLIENDTGQHKPNSTIILSLRKTFAIFKKLGVDGDELEGLLAQAACHPPASLDRVAFDQLVTSSILAKGDEKPSSTFVGQVILNASQRDDKQHTSPFVYRVADPPERQTLSPRPCSPYVAKPFGSTSEVRRPPDHLVDRFGGSCFHCGRTGHWRADCPVTKGFANPNPRPPSPGPFRSPRLATPDRRSQHLSGPPYQQERVLQVKFVEHDAVDRVLVDTGASIHLSGSARSATNLKDVPPFRIFFADSNSSITISKTATLNIPVRRGFMIVQDVPFSSRISGTILSVGRLCRAGVVPFFDALSLSLLVCNVLVTTTFLNDCWWINVVTGEETIESAAETSSPRFFEMNPISLPKSTTLSSREWHERLGHACDKVVISFLKQHVPAFDVKTWQTSYCPVCAKAKSTHRLARARTDIPKKDPLDLLVSDVLGPFEEDAQAAILDAIKQLQVRTGVTPKALRTDNAREFTSASFANSLAAIGTIFCPSLPYSPQENGEAERLNRTLGDMARAMVVQSQMPTRFWQFAYASASYIHNRIPNSRCPKTSPHQELFGYAPSITTLYPHGADAVVHIPAVQQQGKLEPRAIDCKLLRLAVVGSLQQQDDTICECHLSSVPNVKPGGYCQQGLPPAHPERDVAGRGTNGAVF
ncbi:hypothetical protein O181_026545 [Austropuccinia psidii MF-1]|uniref:Endonuclease n=1 Tax=Austropuccinia psidii MF-1 TaxID=1389203 RepID=A0A9Q3CPL3_9BASI|nr:hypothetical protein [Austropuccinia psidii MF-1]